MVAGTPVHSSSSAADITVNTDSNFLKQEIKTNLAEVEYQFTPKYGARLGFRHVHRAIADNFFNDLNALYFPSNAAQGNCARVNPALPVSQSNLPKGCTLNNDGSISFVTTPPPTLGPPGLTFINEYAGVFGFWAKPTANWRIKLRHGHNERE